MPILTLNEIEPSGYLAVWAIRENEDFFRTRLRLCPPELKSLSEKKGMRRLEWLAARYLLFYLSPPGAVFRKDLYGKPHLTNFPFHISVSHSRGAVAAAISRRPVGVDIQGFSRKIEELAFKFTQKEEEACLREDRHKQLHVLWGAKEVLYKACGRRDLFFKDHIRIAPFQYQSSGGQCSGLVEKDDFQAKFNLYYREMGAHLLVYGALAD